MLERYGYEVLEAEDGEATQKLMRNDAGLRVERAVFEVVMLGMDGGTPSGRLRRLIRALAPVLLLATGAASECSIATDSGSGTFEFRISGTVRFLESDGGCWQLLSDDGRHYELLPDQAPASVLRDEARVLVSVQTTGESGTGCDVGQPLRIRRVMSVQAER